jgi:16S rRNA (cytosine1402-N4)-methyltransferase
VYVGEVVDMIRNDLPKKFERKINTVLSRVWQALRVWTNSEFELLEDFLPQAVKRLKIGGRLAVVSFNSLEDKRVAKFMRQLAKPVEVNEFGLKEKSFDLLTPKAIEPDEEEVQKNIRSRSAMLRVIEKLKIDEGK